MSKLLGGLVSVLGNHMMMMMSFYLFLQKQKIETLPQPDDRESVLFIGTHLSNLYTSVDTSAVGEANRKKHICEIRTVSKIEVDYLSEQILSVFSGVPLNSEIPG